MVDFVTYKNNKDQFTINKNIILYFMYRDITLLEKNNYSLSQYENLKKYNIYQSWGLDGLPLNNLLNNDNIFQNLDNIKQYILLHF